MGQRAAVLRFRPRPPRAELRVRARLPVLLPVAAVVAVPIGCYFGAAPPQRRRLRLLLGGVGRFARSLSVGVGISVDYWWTQHVELWGVEEGSAPFEAAMARCHERGAERLLRGALRNGGLYVKLGQGLCAMGHLLPPQYPRVLRALEDRALPQRGQQVDELFLEDPDIPIYVPIYVPIMSPYMSLWRPQVDELFLEDPHIPMYIPIYDVPLAPPGGRAVPGGSPYPHICPHIPIYVPMSPYPHVYPHVPTLSLWRPLVDELFLEDPHIPIYIYMSLWRPLVDELFLEDPHIPIYVPIYDVPLAPPGGRAVPGGSPYPHICPSGAPRWTSCSWRIPISPYISPYPHIYMSLWRPLVDELFLEDPHIPIYVPISPYMSPYPHVYPHIPM
ncbi:uncharacterized aarF domain-containing protein kinase 5 isoform X1 [Gallus gallus]|uniref:AarF domain containing kinase 5 n=1 Tax=Gallus gallus TaxID=9031 RepID=A0A8V0XXZ2_CHICK|nr:uncharacterized aarF domain-containing protein kinase 5 isoform X1 [Gallus gallus]